MNVGLAKENTETIGINGRCAGAGSRSTRRRDMETALEYKSAIRRANVKFSALQNDGVVQKVKLLQERTWWMV